jgi:hypothetical protein
MLVFLGSSIVNFHCFLCGLCGESTVSAPIFLQERIVPVRSLEIRTCFCFIGADRKLLSGNPLQASCTLSD